MLLGERYRYDKEREARIVYRTMDTDHPGVAALNTSTPGSWA